MEDTWIIMFKFPNETWQCDTCKVDVNDAELIAGSVARIFQKMGRKRVEIKVYKSTQELSESEMDSLNGMLTPDVKNYIKNEPDWQGTVKL